jgi:hypothetical protein
MACECAGCGAALKIGDPVSDMAGNKLGKISSIVSEQDGTYITVTDRRGKATVIFVERDSRSFQDLHETEVSQLAAWLENGSRLQ